MAKLPASSTGKKWKVTDGILPARPRRTIRHGQHDAPWVQLPRDRPGPGSISLDDQQGEATQPDPPRWPLPSREGPPVRDGAAQPKPQARPIQPGGMGGGGWPGAAQVEPRADCRTSALDAQDVHEQGDDLPLHQARTPSRWADLAASAHRQQVRSQTPGKPGHTRQIGRQAAHQRAWATGRATP